MIDYSLFKFDKGVPREVVRLEKRRAVQRRERIVRDQVNTRDRRRCFFPACRELAFHKHHKVFRSHGGKWITENIVSGCAQHHRWVHDGLIRLIGNPDRPPLDVELTALGRAARIRIPNRSSCEKEYVA